jgi:hypothetical protein
MPPVANVVISNVPGPQVPLYLAGAQMKTFFPVSIVVHGMALNITVQTYCGRIDFGLIACREAMPDLNDLGTAIEGGFDELVALATVRAEIDRERAGEAARSEAADAAAAVKAVKKSAAKRAATTAASKKPAAKKPAAKKLAAKKPAAKKPAVKEPATKTAAATDATGRSSKHSSTRR